MWTYLSQTWKTASVFCSIWKVLMHWAHSVFLFLVPFGYLNIFWYLFFFKWACICKETPAEGRVLSCENVNEMAPWTFLTYHIELCDSIFTTVLYAHAFYGKENKKKNPWRKAHIQSRWPTLYPVTTSLVGSYLRTFSVYRRDEGWFVNIL